MNNINYYYNRKLHEFQLFCQKRHLVFKLGAIHVLHRLSHSCFFVLFIDYDITNIIEGLNRQFRQITKNKPSFTNDDSLRKMLYLASQKIVERWTQRCRNWDVVLSQLSIIFEARIPAWFAPENRISCPQNVIHALACITFRRQESRVDTGLIRKPDCTAINYSVIAWRIIIYTKFYGLPNCSLLYFVLIKKSVFECVFMPVFYSDSKLPDRFIFLNKRFIFWFLHKNKGYFCSIRKAYILTKQKFVCHLLICFFKSFFHIFMLQKNIQIVLRHCLIYDICKCIQFYSRWLSEDCQYHWNHLHINYWSEIIFIIFIEGRRKWMCFPLCLIVSRHPTEETIGF